MDGCQLLTMHAGLLHQRSRLGKQPSVGTYLEPIADGAESSTQGDEGSESIEGRSPSVPCTPPTPLVHMRSRLQPRPAASPDPQLYVPMSEEDIQEMLKQCGNAPPLAVGAVLHRWSL